MVHKAPGFTQHGCCFEVQPDGVSFDALRQECIAHDQIDMDQEQNAYDRTCRSASFCCKLAQPLYLF
eukprot:4258407-Ditylum_brightwellii.AAC.2